MFAKEEHQFIRKLVSNVLWPFDHSYGEMSNLLSNAKWILENGVKIYDTRIFSSVPFGK